MQLPAAVHGARTRRGGDDWYYIVILAGHAAEGLNLVGVSIVPTLAMAASIPIVAVLVGLGMHWIIRRAVAGKS